MIFEMTDYRNFLQLELKKRCDANANYSLRAFAGKLKVPASTLSEVLNRKAGLSLAKAKQISANLNLSDIEQDYFVTLVESFHARSKRDRELAKIRLLKLQKTRAKKLDAGTWQVISNWYHAGILELSKVQGFQSEPQWIAKTLGISPKEARQACDRLLRLGILRLDGKNLRPTGLWLLKSPEEIPSDTIKQFHVTLLKKAAEEIYKQPIDRRNYSSLLMAISNEKLPEAKKLIAEFNQKLSTLMTSASDRDSLYCFSTQLFRVGEDVQ